MASSAWAGQEDRKSIHAVLRLLQAPRQQECPGLQQNQFRRAIEQLVRQLLAPTQERTRPLAIQQGFDVDPLEKADGDFRLLGQQGVAHRLLDVLALCVVPAGLAIQPGPALLGQAVGKHRSHRRVHPPVPAPLRHRFDESTGIDQLGQRRKRCVQLEQGLVETGVKARQAGQQTQGIALQFVEIRQQLALQVTQQQLLGAGRAIGLPRCQQAQPDAGEPASGLLHQLRG
ncbi:hypothetical protein D3C78_842180 [compost metagenome]